VGHPKRANLVIEWPMAVQEQEIANPIVIASNGNASFVHYRHASHDERIRQFGFQRCHVTRRKQFRRCAQMNDRRVKFACTFRD
jgi:hypothetical protein